jgi:hypothetical protein
MIQNEQILAKYFDPREPRYASGNQNLLIAYILPLPQHTENIIYQMYISGFSRLQDLS